MRSGMGARRGLQNAHAHADAHADANAHANADAGGGCGQSSTCATPITRIMRRGRVSNAVVREERARHSRRVGEDHERGGGYGGGR
eukprot:5182359-Pleurochrysis_carterae.AAC.1